MKTRLRFNLRRSKHQSQRVLVSALVLSLASLALSACGGSGGNPTSNTTSSISPTTDLSAKVIDLTQAKLLSDSELTMNAFPNLAPPSVDETNWLQSNHQKLRSLTYDADFSDLNFLETLLRNKRIVQLGESSHGTREFSQAKVRLIKYLHQKLGYKVIAFESSIIGCYLQQQEIARGNSVKVNDSCIFSVWGTNEVQELMSYIERTQKTANPLQLAGFDEQYSGRFDHPNHVKGWLTSVLANLKDTKLDPIPDLAEQGILIGTNGSMCYANKASSECKSFLATYASTATELAKYGALLKPYADAASPANKQSLQMAYLTVSNLQKRLEILRQDYDQASFYEPRDKAMADNINELANTIYPQEKIIVWAHNGHISHGISGYANSGRTMGSFLVKTWGEQLYSIGLFMLRGETANNDRTVIQVQAPMANSLEAYAASLKLAAYILPLPTTNQAGTGDDWLFQPINFYVWGKYPTRAPINEQFNALLIVDHSSMPDYAR